ncbi:hypothetical protein D3C81_1535140 [compost metagenome]
MPVVGADSNGQQAVKVGALQAVQFIEGAVGTSTGIHVDHAQFGTGVGGIAGNGGVLGQGALATGQGEQAPAQFGPTFTLAGHGAFALTIGQ